MITKDDVGIHLVKTTTKTGKPILKGHAAINGFAVQKLVGFQSKKNPDQWVVSEDTEADEDKKLFTFFENTFENKKGEDTFVLKCPEFSIHGLNFPLSGFLGYKYPKFDQWGNEMFTCNMKFDQNTYDYYNGKTDDKYPKKYVLENKKITFDASELEILEKNSYKEFTTLKESIFAGRVGKIEQDTAMDEVEAKIAKERAEESKPKAKAKSKAKPF